MGMKVKVDISGIPKKVDRICRHNGLGIYAAETFARLMVPYVPMDTGTLSQSYTTEPRKVIYNQPYAHRLYEGEGFNFSKEKHPLATAHWDEAAKAAKGKQFADELAKYIRRM